MFGDPHFYTFDNMTYTFNGKGEYVLVRADNIRHKLDVQGRFEAVPNNVYGTSRATVLTGIAGKSIVSENCYLDEKIQSTCTLNVAAQENTSMVVEVRLRPAYAQWRYRLDVLVDGKNVYFDTFSRHIQYFKGKTTENINNS